MDAKRPPLPLVLTANHLLGGQPIYRTIEGWSDNASDAVIGADEVEATRLEVTGYDSINSAEVVDPYLITVALDAEGRAMPVHYRERIRVTGPTIAVGTEADRARAELAHVSL